MMDVAHFRWIYHEQLKQCEHLSTVIQKLKLLDQTFDVRNSLH